MKYLLTAIAILTLALSSCGNVPANGPDGTPSAESVSTEAASENAIEIVGGNEESLREFIRQWVGPVSPDGTSQDVTVYIGSTLNDIPYDLPTPEGTRVIGSITGSWVDYMLLFDTSLPSEAVHEFYAQALKDKGWQEAPMNQGAGFTSGSDVYQGYCYGENEAYLSVETPSSSAEGTSIRLNLDVSPESYVCNAAPNAGPDYSNLIPQLKAPKGVTVQGAGAGASDRDANITANLKGDLSAAEVADFYHEQMRAAGWEMQNGGEGEGAAWSHWTFQDEQGTDWIGALIVLEVSTDSDALFALVTIAKK
jgi:hypothetical protein